MMTSFAEMWDIFKDLEVEAYISLSLLLVSLACYLTKVVSEKWQAWLTKALQKFSLSLAAYNRVFIYFLLALMITSIAPLYEAAILKQEFGVLAEGSLKLSDLIIYNQIHAIHFAIMFACLAALGSSLTFTLTNAQSFPITSIATYFAGWGLASATAIQIVNVLFIGKVI